MDWMSLTLSMVGAVFNSDSTPNSADEILASPSTDLEAVSHYTMDIKTTARHFF